jgi:multicomponent Na+:H+ antiporter subunit A
VEESGVSPAVIRSEEGRDVLALLLAGLAIAAVTALAPRAMRRLTDLLSIGYPLAVVAWAASRLPVVPGSVEVESHAWVPAWGVQLAFARDGLATVFALLIGGIGTLVALYASGYLAGAPYRRRFAALFVLFATAMLGVVLADDLITLFVFWELTSIASFLLIGLDHEKSASRRAALQALLVTGAGGVALLGGFLCLALAGIDAGLPGELAFRISALRDVTLTDHPLYPLGLVLILLGAFTKSAQVPFHFWLPSAMAAPTPVSAFLHSATMVKAGVFLLARMHPLLGGTDLWVALVVPAGAATMLVAAAMAVAQRDMKRILAYSTVAVLGILTMLLGVGTVQAIEAALVLLVAHALYKAALFLVAGNVDHETGTRDVTQVGGLARAMPWTAAAAGLAAFSKAGAPPMFGFFGKELLYAAKLDLETLDELMIVVAVAANVLLVAAAVAIALPPFFGARRAPREAVHEAPWRMRAGPLLLAAAGLFVGLIPGAFDAALGSAAATDIAGQPVVMKLKLWHGLNPEALAVLGLSAVTLLVGYGVYRAARPRLAAVAGAAERLGRFGPHRLYDASLAGLLSGSERFSAGVGSAPLGRALAVALVATLAAGGTLMLAPPALAGTPPLPAGAPLLALVGLFTVFGALITALSRRPLTALAGLGATGAGVGILFLLFSAPDLAITQILVETLVVMVLLPVLARRPETPRREPLRRRPGRLLLAALAGGLVAVLSAAVSNVSLPADLTAFVDSQSYPAALGRNVVNVVLVDFRALDTLGEIIVVAAAALGVLAWIGRARSRPDDEGEDRP